MVACCRTGLPRELGDQTTSRSGCFAFSHLSAGCMCQIRPLKLQVHITSNIPFPLHACLSHSTGRTETESCWPAGLPLVLEIPQPLAKQAEPAGKLKVGWGGSPSGKSAFGKTSVANAPEVNPPWTPGLHFVTKQGMVDTLKTTGPSFCVDIAL